MASKVNMLQVLRHGIDRRCLMNSWLGRYHLAPSLLPNGRAAGQPSARSFSTSIYAAGKKRVLFLGTPEVRAARALGAVPGVAARRSGLSPCPLKQMI